MIRKDVDDLLAQLDGQTVVRFDRTEQTVHLAGEVTHENAQNLRQGLLIPLVNPSIGVVVLVVPDRWRIP